MDDAWSHNRKIYVTGLVSCLIGFLLTVFSGCSNGPHNLLLRQPKRLCAQLEWEDLGPTPEGENGFTPQGMTCANGRLIFANSWNDKKSRVYVINVNPWHIVASFDMPSEAVHTSGLDFDGQFLWAVDYISNRCYKIDLDASLQCGKACVVGSFETGLKGTSACAFVPFRGRTCLAISDYGQTARTYLVDHEKAIHAKQMNNAILFSYTNEAYPQGLVWIGSHLLEAENKQGTDIINQVSVEGLNRTPRVRESTVRQLNAPDRGVEDLAWDGEYLYTSDELTYRFYRARLR